MKVRNKKTRKNAEEKQKKGRKIRQKERQKNGHEIRREKKTGK